MAQVISTLCDECLEAGEETPGDTYGIVLEVPGAKPAPYLIDVCDVHAKPYRDLLETLANVGRRADRKSPLPRSVSASRPVQPGGEAGAQAAPVTGEELPCPACGHVSPNRSALRSHARAAHSSTLDTLEGKPTAECPAGCGQVLAMRAQGITAHLVRSHGLTKAEAAPLTQGALHG